ncbi:phosphonate C-P lyase system protein PhnG [Ensifer sp. SSB1]|uniref:phosphonate C-P lyase system protein PhnG n=1 Tax=Ensifer sp. SSB1 TaxID=2795385 RepID=UPI001A5FDE6B|nr:phosphonate C-P lyase system protein PhnG [Ensifer sp. SSB1]MBK5566434.1 phosphonate C-P lyase system protein PhnG [Ensifer sp. SSB1]
MDAKLKQESPPDPARKKAMGLLARATLDELTAAWEALADKPEVHPVRGPETGLVMVRGRIGGSGDPFNLGEATVSRATIRLSTGEIGHGQMLGTDRQRARLAAIFDALSQRDGDKVGVEALLGCVAERLAQEERRKAEETAATRVDFFTMVRGDD